MELASHLHCHARASSGGWTHREREEYLVDGAGDEPSRTETIKPVGNVKMVITEFLSISNTLNVAKLGVCETGVFLG